jgi:hypothetical protein
MFTAPQAEIAAEAKTARDKKTAFIVRFLAFRLISETGLKQQ